MSNNNEYTKEYIDRVDGHFHSLERVLLIPARDKTLTFQQVEELFSRFGEMDSMKEYLVDNPYYVEQLDELEETKDEYEEVKKALLKLKVQLDTFYHCVEEESQEQYSKWLDTLDELAEGEIPEELKDKPKKKSKK